MAAMTRAELSTLVLEHLGVKAAGQTASAEDVSRTLQAIDAVYAEHKRDRIAPWEPEATPEWAQFPMRDCVAFELSGLFGISGERLQLIAAAYQRALLKLHRYASGKADTRVRTEAKYY